MASTNPHTTSPQEAKPEGDAIELQSIPKDPEVGEHAPTDQKLSWWAKYHFEVKLSLALLLPVFVETLDYTVVASAQPQIASAFNRLDLQTWIGTSYVLTSTAFLPLFSNLADILGRHACLQVGFAIFLIGSVISTAAQTMPMVLAGRGIAGAGAAAMLTVVRVIFADNRSLNAQTWRTAMFSLLFSVGYATGPVIGGALSSVNFRWIFAINLPISVVGSIAAFLLIRHGLLGPQPDPRDKLPGWRVSQRPSLLVKLTRVDWIGAAFFITGTILVLMGLSWGSTDIWNQPKVIGTITVGGVLIVIFCVWEYWLGQYEVLFNHDGTRMDPEKELSVPPRLVSHTNRMIPLWIFLNRQVSVAFYCAFTGGMVMFGCLYFLAIYWSIVAGFQNTKGGTQLVYLAPGLGAGVWTASMIVNTTRQPRWAIMLGQVVQAVAVGLLGLATSQNKHAQISGFLAMAGAGIGMSIGMTEMQARFLLPKQQNAVSTTMSLFFRTAGGTIGLAQLSAVLETKLRSYITGLVHSGKLSADDALTIAQSLSSTGGDQSSGPGIRQLSPALEQVVKNAYGYGVKWAFYSLLPWVCLAALAAFTLGNIVDTDRVAREEREALKKLEEKQAADADADADADAGQARPSTTDAHGVPAGASTDGLTPGTSKPKKEVGEGPRYRGPFMYLVYGIELLIGTRKRRTKH